jgi:delta8-fatty-acid desaturase
MVTSRQLPLVSRDEVAQRVTQGATLIIYHSTLINATSWAPNHPGGALALLHFVGRDASDEIDAYHSTHALQRMERFVVGRVDVDEDTGWQPLTPPIALGLVRHPDGIKGHWAREGMVSLGQAVMQRAVMLDDKAAVPINPVTRTPVAPTAEIITLTPDQLEPAGSTVDVRLERKRSKAYQQLRRKLLEAGMFNPPEILAGYGSDILRYILLGGMAFGLFFTYVPHSDGGLS